MTTIDELRDTGLLDDVGAGKFVRRGISRSSRGTTGIRGWRWGCCSPIRGGCGGRPRVAGGVRAWAPDVVCGPLVGGALVGEWVAHEVGAAFVYAEPRPATGAGARYAVPGEVRSVLQGARVAVVDDVVNAGAATRACVREVEIGGGSVVGVAALIARAPGWLDGWENAGGKVRVLVRIGWNTWPASGCPLCRSGVPVESP